MKKLIILLMVLVISPIAFAQSTNSDINRSNGFGKLSFEVELNKKTYLPFEPFFVKFKLSNQTKTSLTATRPQFLHDSVLRITNFRGETTEVTSLTLTSGGGHLLPGSISILQPLQSYEDQNVPAINPDLFAEPGKYRLQFILCEGANSLESNVVEILVEKPQGVDADAFEFLNEHGKDVWFGNIFHEKDGLALMQTFVNRYGQSGYGEYAIYQLGLRYFHTGELDKAQTEFEKVKSSHNKFIVNAAKNFLADIKKRKDVSQKQP